MKKNSNKMINLLIKLFYFRKISQEWKKKYNLFTINNLLVHFLMPMRKLY